MSEPRTALPVSRWPRHSLVRYAESEGRATSRSGPLSSRLGGKTQNVCPLKLLPNKTDVLDTGSSEVSRPGGSKV